LEAAAVELFLEVAAGVLPLEAVELPSAAAELPSEAAEARLSAFPDLGASSLPRSAAAAPGPDRTNPNDCRQRCLRRR